MRLRGDRVQGIAAGHEFGAERAGGALGFNVVTKLRRLRLPLTEVFSHFLLMWEVVGDGCIHLAKGKAGQIFDHGFRRVALLVASNNRVVCDPRTREANGATLASRERNSLACFQV